VIFVWQISALCGFFYFFIFEKNLGNFLILIFSCVNFILQQKEINLCKNIGEKKTILCDLPFIRISNTKYVQNPHDHSD
jgi:hypothetical protein